MKALDLFAGTGWGVACKWLGIEEDGVELMKEAVATREANGMNTIFSDVWDGLLLTKEQFREKYGEHILYIASPPCQTFSQAGNGAGRKALNEVLEAIEIHAYKDPEALREFGRKHDDRTALVLAPLAYIWRDMPEFVVLEQVATVQPVWEAYASVLRDLGYSVETAILNAEQYGVPQTRRRSILVASLHGEAKLPTPTHSRYYPRTPEKLDPGVKKWVTMREALGWGLTKRPYPTIAPGTENGGTDPAALGGSGARAGVYAERAKGNWAPSGDADNDGGILRIRADEAAALQTYPVAFTQNNKLAHQAKRSLDQPAPTVTAGHDSGNRGFLGDGDFRIASPEEVAALQSYPKYLRSNYGTSGDKDNRGERSVDQPAATLTSKASRNKWDGKVGMEPGEAASLQTYEKPFVWCGARSKQYLQIGNAVPPVLALAVLSAVVHPAKVPVSRRRRTLV